MLRKAKFLAIAAAIAVCIAMVLPMSAMAATKASSRFYGVGSTVVVSNPTTTTAAALATITAQPIMQGKLQRYSGGKWVNLGGTVRVIFSDTTTTTVVFNKYVKAGSYFKVRMTKRGSYKAVYAGSSTTKSTYKTRVRKDDIISVVSTPTATFDTTAGVTTVTLSQIVSWNPALATNFSGAIGTYAENFTAETTTSAEVLHNSFYSERQIPGAGTYQVVWPVVSAEVPGLGWRYEGIIDFDDPYLVDRYSLL